MLEIIIFLQVILVLGGPLFLLHIKRRVGSYAAEIGKIEAINRKIDDVVDQQKILTKATEETKAEIAHSAWLKKESQIIKRQKLEEYIENVISAIELMRVAAARTYGNKKVDTEALPVTTVAKISTIQMLYLPELDKQNRQIVQLVNQYEDAIVKFELEEISLEQFNKLMISIFSELGAASSDLTSASKIAIESLVH